MQIVEARLKEIVLEEVHSRLVERQWQQFRTAMREELAKEGIHLTEEELEEAMSDKWKRRMATLGAGAALTGGIVGTGTLAQRVAQRGEETHQQWQQAGEQEEHHEEESWKIENMRKHLDNTAKWQWDWSEEPEVRDGGAVMPTTLPMLVDQDRGKVGVFPPEFSVFKQTHDDFVSGEGRKYLPEDVVEAVGDAEENRVNFPDEMRIPRHYDKWAGGDAGVLDQALNQGFVNYGVAEDDPIYSAIIYVDFDNIPEDYMLPSEGVSKSEYYNKVWESFVEGEVEPGAPVGKTTSGLPFDPGATSWHDPEWKGEYLKEQDPGQ